MPVLSFKPGVSRLSGGRRNAPSVIVQTVGRVYSELDGIEPDDEAWRGMDGG